MTYRYFYDAVGIENLPEASMYAGYVGGNYVTYPALVAKYPHARIISIAVQADQNAQVLDVENGDATADQAPAWVARQRKLGRKRPTVYTFRANMPAVLAAFAKTHQKLPDLWIADWTNAAHSIPGTVAVQFATGNYDSNCISDAHWPDTRVQSVKRKVTAPVRKVVKSVKKVVRKAAKKPKAK